MSNEKNIDIEVGEVMKSLRLLRKYNIISMDEFGEFQRRLHKKHRPDMFEEE